MNLASPKIRKHQYFHVPAHVARRHRLAGSIDEPMGVATATVILVANSLGRGDKAQMKRIIRESYWISTFLMVLVSGVILLFGQGLSGLFTDNKAAIAASQVARATAWTTPPPSRSSAT